MNLELVRVHERHDATLGILIIDDYPRMVTLEPPWMGNARNVSCIPNGRYRISRTTSKRFGETFEVVRVPNRSHILFHAGNIRHNTQGCILVGRQFSPTIGNSMILESKDAMEWFLRYLSGVDEADLTVKSAYSMGASAI
jgi:hypothetical protein